MKCWSFEALWSQDWHKMPEEDDKRKPNYIDLKAVGKVNTLQMFLASLNYSFAFLWEWNMCDKTF